MRRLASAVFVLGLLAASCGDDGSTTDTTTPDSTTTSSTSTTAAAVTTTLPDSELPGERVEIFPYEGATLAVVGVAADDTLNVRTGPGVDFDVVTELDPLATDIVATGHNRSLGNDGFWSQITVDGRTGWVNTAFVLQLGQVNDITSTLFPTPADRPGAETMLELGNTVGGMRASEEPRSRIVVVDGPTVGDLGEITVDVIGLGDDAVGGERLHVFANPDASGEGFVVRTVEATTLCSRGVDPEGLCV